MGTAISKYGEYAAFAVSAAVFTFLLTFKLPATPILIEADHLLFAYEAARMYNGDVIYRDFFEFTLPGTQTLYTLFFAAFGMRYWIIPALSILLSAAYSIILLKISTALIPGILRFAAPLLFIFFGYRWFGIDGTHRMLSPIFILLAIFVVLRGKRARNFVLAGILCALTSFFTQQRGVAVAGAIGLFLVIEVLMNGREIKDAAKLGSALFTSFVVTIAILCAPFVVAAGWEHFAYAVFVYPAFYYTAGDPNSYAMFFGEIGRAFQPNGLNELIASFVIIFFAIILPAVTLGVFLQFLIGGKSAWHLWRDRVFLSVIGIILLIATVGPTPSRLFQISGPALILLALTLSSLPWVQRNGRPLMSLAAVILIFLAGIQIYRTQYFWKYEILDMPTGRVATLMGEVADKYSWLLDNTKPGEFIYEAQTSFVYFPLQLGNPTGIGQVWPSEYTRPEQVQEVIIALQNQPPPIILWEKDYSKAPQDRAPGDPLSPLYEYLNANYTRTKETWITQSNHAYREAWVLNTLSRPAESNSK